MSDVGAVEEETWVLVNTEWGRRGTSWTLWRWSTAPEMGKLEANETAWYVGTFERAGELFLAFSQQ